MKDLDICDKEYEKILNEICKTIWQFDSGWIYEYKGINNKVTFLHREHNHHLYSFHFRKNRFLYQSKPIIKRTASLI